MKINNSTISLNGLELNQKLDSLILRKRKEIYSL